MNVADFNSLAKLDQAILVATEAQLIGERIEDEFGFSLYRLHDFFVEISVEKANHTNTNYKAIEAEPTGFSFIV